MPGPPRRALFYPMDRRATFAMSHLDRRWPDLERWLMQDPEDFYHLPGGRPFQKRQSYNDRRNN